MRKFKKAFTLIELVMVIVVIAILAYNAIPDYKRNNRAEAINHILTMIRYTQNLALHDDKHSATDTRWQHSYWRFGINNCSNGSGLYYYIGTDNDLNGNISQEESAIDPANGKYMIWSGAQPCPTPSSLSNNVSPNIFITQKYGINNVQFRSCSIMRNNNISSSAARHIGFDNFGRPFKSYLGNNNNTPTYSGYVRRNCTIRFDFEDGSPSFTIVIPAESGFAYLQSNPSL